MKISLDWISDFVDISKLSAEEIGRTFTAHTAEVEGVEDEAAAYANMVIGKVLSLKKHPEADRLVLAQVDIGESTSVQIVCGGQNLFEGMLVAVAKPGAWVRWHGEGDLVELSEAKIRGEKSFGMICAGEEIGLPADNTAESKEVRIADLTSTGKKPGTALAEALGKTDRVMEVDNKSLTHRPDLWGHYGIARELAAIHNKKLASLSSFIKIPPTKGSASVHVDIQDKDLCPRFSSAIVTGIRVEPSPLWMQARLKAAGMNTHNNIVDITNYVMLELGQPMHAYDRKLIGDTLRVRFAKKGEKLLTLEGTEHALSPEDPVVANGKDEAIGLAGIKGGLHSGIHDSTTELILEAAHWDPVVVRKSATRNSLRTDASQRFEKDQDPMLTELAIERALKLIFDLCPEAKLEGPVKTVGTWEPKKILITVSPTSICSKIGVQISTPKMTALLKALEFKVEKAGKNLAITVPSHRATRDVLIPEDIVEEVARMVGYDAIPAILPEKSLELPRENVERSLKHKARNILALGLGFTEVMNYSFYGKDRLEKCGLNEKDHLKVLNYLSLDQTHLRTTLTPNLLANIATNAREQEALYIFELGHTYKETGDFMPLEEKRLTAAVAETGESFYTAKGALESFLKNFGVTDYTLTPSAKPLPYAHPKKSVDLVIQDKTVGSLFTVHPGVKMAFDIPQDVAIFSLQFSDLIHLGRKTPHFKPLPKFPALPFDLSILVARQDTVEKWSKAIRSVIGTDLIEQVELFDIYEGKNLPENKKSLSFRITLRHPEHTLTESEFQTFYSSVCTAINAAGGTIRGA